MILKDSIFVYEGNVENDHDGISVMELWDHQEIALNKLKNGSVLVGDTGSGKSMTALAYYKKLMGGLKKPPKALYVITTAKKRDEGDWIREAQRAGVTELTVDSWNNIKKYKKVKESMFIFDEQRVINYKVWTKTFLKITNLNRWILLTATPADTWMDLMPVFIANGFFRNKTQFTQDHVNYAPHVKYPKILGYRNEALLERYKDFIFVVMPDQRHTKQHIVRIPVDYNDILVKKVMKTQWNPFTDTPVKNFSEEVHLIRKIINSNPSRIEALVELHRHVKKVIIFYNFNYELAILKQWFDPITTVGQHNGYVHEPVPVGEDWVYLVQYASGSEAWECYTTNHMAFYSLNYSYRTVHQARGRIDRHNTHYTDLYYYELVSDSPLDKAILKAYEGKKDFNIRMLDWHPREKHVV